MVRVTRLRIFPVSIGATALALSFVVGLCLAAALARPAPASAAGPGPIAAWSFDEGEGTTVEDLTGDGHNGTIEGAEWVRGKYGDALRFDGAGDVVKIPDSPEFDLTEEFTLEAWVRPESGSDEWAPILAKEMGGGEAYGELAWWLYEGSGESNRPVAGTEPSPGEEDKVYAPDPLPVGAWSHIAVTWDGAGLRLYVDGELVASASASPPPVTGGELEIGAATEHGDHFVGRIDEVRIYDRALDTAEVQADMEAPLQTPKRGPVAAYSFDEGEGTTVEDMTGDGHTATIHGASWTTHGKYGGAMEFDGEDDYLTVPDSPELELSEELTLEAWVRPQGYERWDPIVAKRMSPGENPYEATYFLDDGDSTPGVAYGGTVHSEHELDSAEALPEDVWSHIALTYDGARARLYVDGELVGEEAAGPPPATTGELVIGGDPLSEDFFHGRIDEVRIYDSALDQAEVAADMEAPIQTPKQGPIAAWSFDEGEGTTVQDVTGDGHTATIEGAGWTKGKYGDGLKFDGKESTRLSVPYSPEFHLGEEFTLEAWVRPESGSNEWASIVAQEGDGGSPEHELTWYLFEAGSHTNGPFGGTEPVHGEETTVGAPWALPVGTWSHVAITWDGARGRFYVDGRLVDEGPVGPPPVSEGGLQIGDHYDGRLDELRVYDRALDTAEVQTDMEAPLQTPKQGPIAAYSFDEGEGTTVEDLTGDGHTGTIEGAEWVRGEYGDALRFDGAEDVVKIPNSPEFDLTEGFTLEAWVRPESGSDEWAPILAKEIGGGEASHELAWWLYEGDWESNKPYGGTEPTPGDETDAAAHHPLPVDAWSHVAVTFDGSEARLYVDGGLVDCNHADPPPVTGGELQIGAATEHGDHFVGRIDEVRIYNRALTPAEVVTSMQPLPTPATGESYEVGGTEAILTGTINPKGLETGVIYEWGPTTAYGETYPSSPDEEEEWVSGNEPEEVEQAIDELEPETTYHYRVVAQNAIGTVVGPDRTFTTGASEFAPDIAPKDFAGDIGVNWSGYFGTSNFDFVAESGAKMFRAVVNPPFGNEAERNATKKKNDNLFKFMASHHVKVLPDVSGIVGMEATAGNKLPSIAPGTVARERWIAGLESLVTRYGPEGSFWKEKENSGLNEEYAPVYWEIWR